GAHTDRRRAANHHVFDRPGDIVDVLAGDVDFFGRQLSLIDHDDVVTLPRNCREHSSLLSYKRDLSNGSGRRSFIRSVSFTSVRFAMMTSMSPQNSQMIWRQAPHG